MKNFKKLDFEFKEIHDYSYGIFDSMLKWNKAKYLHNHRKNRRYKPVPGRKGWDWHGMEGKTDTFADCMKYGYIWTNLNVPGTLNETKNREIVLLF